MKNERLKRIITGIIIVIVTFPILFFTDTLVITFYMMFVAVVGVFELLRCFKLNKWYILIPAEGIAVASHVISRLRLFGLKDIETEKLLYIYIFMAVLFVFYLFSLSVFMPDKYNIETNGFAGLMCVYVIAGSISPVLLCEIPNGMFAFPLIFISAWMTDVFAYGFGRKIGKHKLCPTISPKKSIEGAICGIAGNIIGFIIYAVVIMIAFKRQVSASYPALIITAVLLSVISQIGDLIMSLVKRRFGVKDFGKILPGHGGVLDRFDSITAVSIFIFMFYSILKAARIFI